MFQLIHLKSFIAVAEELHFGRAAERLHLTQPPLSRHVQQLEHDVGVALVERSNRVVSLTAAGRAFLVDARQILRLADDATASARRTADGVGGALTVGFIPASGYELVPRIVGLIAREMASVDVVLKELVTADQIEAMSARRIDLGILRLPVDPDRFETLCVDESPMVVAMPEDHPLALNAEIDLRALDGQAFIMYAAPESRYHFALLTRLFARAGVAPRFVQHARETHTMLALVGARLGIAIVPSNAARLRPPNVTIRRIVGHDDVRSAMSLAWPKRHDNPVLTRFCDLARRELGR
jgi:DNA-binding transcriptional LysR family regulator